MSGEETGAIYRRLDRLELKMDQLMELQLKVTSCPPGSAMKCLEQNNRIERLDESVKQLIEMQRDVTNLVTRFTNDVDHRLKDLENWKSKITGSWKSAMFTISAVVAVVVAVIAGFFKKAFGL